jgi:geranylgeranyl diphosphate synthase type I
MTEASILPTFITQPLNHLWKSAEIQSRLAEIDETIQEYLANDHGKPSVLYEAAHHLIKAGGKRVRSLIAILSCEAVGGTIEAALPLALAAELLQTASLIHDDIIDDEEIRRGVDAVHRKYGEHIAILAGDLLIAQAIQILGELGNTEIIKNIGIGGIRLCEGEAADLLMDPAIAKSFTKAEYFETIDGKTVAFMESAAKAGVIVGSGTKEQYDALVNYARYVGYAFQLKDDILDIEPALSSEIIPSDLILKRGNYVLIYALDESSEDDQKRCITALNMDDIKPALQLIEKTNAISSAEELTRAYVERAKNALEGHGLKGTEILKQIADFCLLRGV